MEDWFFAGLKNHSYDRYQSLLTRTINQTLALLTNLSEIPTCCLFLQFLYFIDKLDVL